MSQTSTKQVVSPLEAAKYLGVSKATLRRWRSSGKGPRFVRYKSGTIKYCQGDLDNWIETSLRRSTSDPGPEMSAVQ